MTERRIFAAILLILAAGAGYLAFVLWRADESGNWLFLVVALFFLAVGAPMLKEPKPPAETPTRFVSHRFMTLVMVVIVLGIIAAIVSAVLRG